MFTVRKDDLVRRRTIRAIKKHSATLAIQFTFSAFVAVLWYLIFWAHGVHIEHGDSDLILTGILVIVAAAWVLLATETLRFVLDQHQRIVAAVKHGDEETIIDLKDDHIPLIIPFYLSALSLIIEVIALLFPYASVMSGLGSIFICTLVICFYGALIYEIEDPTEGGWVRNQILKHDPTLLEIDSDEHFRERWRKRKRKKEAAD